MSARVYGFLDSSSLFENRVVPADRSRTNIPFKLRQPGLEGEFIEFARANGLANLRGNLALGLRASMYNAMTMQGVERLVETMGEFERAHA